MTTRHDNTLPAKAMGLFGSIRFWGVVLGTAVGVVKALGVITEEVATAIIAGIGTVVGIGTIDKVAETMASRKPPAH